MKNYYKVLGIAQSASDSDISHAYHTLADQYSPQKNKGDKYAEERFIDISVAYKTLMNKDKRKDYDIILNSILSASERNELEHASIYNETYEDAVVEITNRKPAGPYYSIALAAIILIAIVSLLIKKHGPGTPAPVENKMAIIANKPATIKAPQQPQVVPHAAPVPAFEPSNNNKEPVKKGVAILHALPTSFPVVADTQFALPEITPIPIPVAEYTIGSVKQDVLNIQGTPNAIVRYDNTTEMWRYADSKIEFVNGRVVSIENKSNNLFVQSN